MEKSHFLEKIGSYINKHQLIDDNCRVLVALSGGADSVALLISLHSLGYKCIAAHCNFHLRGEDSNRDEQFVRELTRKFKIQVTTIDFDVPAYAKSKHLSIEMACRELRYDWFENIRLKYNCDAIAVGHHKDDNIETFFLNILRGSGIKGLAAIKPINGKIVRPMLDVTRIEIEQFLKSLEQSYVTDITNFETDYKRNKIRNILLPQISDMFPNSGLTRTLDNITSCNDFYQGAIKRAKDEVIKQNTSIVVIDTNRLLKIEGYQSLLFEIINQYNFNSTQCEEIISTLHNTGSIYLSPSHRLIINRDTIEISKSAIDEKQEYKFYLNNLPDTLPIKLDIEIKDIVLKYENDKRIAYFNMSILSKEITLRHWRAGDRMIPFGMKGSKKLSDIFTDNKLSIFDKENIWVLECANEIIWIPGLKHSASFKCKENSEIVVLRMI
ncbi:MAG: tRNA lysidine(34) synthetase TilS [Muribaculaceae bacterium]|nr:tRNA lysidine(34) synthetase TilS [Muribaculaceae bacterium]